MYGSLEAGRLIQSRLQHKGFIPLSNFPKRPEGGYYEHYSEEGGVYVPQPLIAEEELAAILAAELKEERERLIEKSTITTASGRVFDADRESMGNVVAAEAAARIINQTEVKWRLADNSEAVIPLSELQEALVLIIKNIGDVINVKQPEPPIVPEAPVTP